MKNTIATLGLIAAIFTVGNAQAARVTGASVDIARKTVSVDVVYGGGCKEHSFKLVNNTGCFETYPVSCRLELIEDANGDMCEAMIYKKIQFTFAELGFNDSYYSRAGITILGDNGSKAGFRLPEIN